MTETGAVESGLIHSPWIGDVEWHPQCEIFFPAGLPGFEQERRLLPVEIPSQRPLVYLQSVERPEVCFLCLPVFVIDPRFELHLGDDERAALNLADGCEPAIGVDVLCLALLARSEHAVQTNMGAPVVINLHNSLGIQALGAGRARNCFRLHESGRWERVC